MADNEEVWRPAPEWPKYEVSSHGRLRNKGTRRVLKTAIRQYHTVSLPSPGGYRTVLVHRLIAGAFIPNPSNLPVVNHINGIKTDNSLSNLEWVTYQENSLHASRTGLRCQDPQKGRRVMSIDPMTGEIVEYISMQAAAVAVGVDNARIYICAKNHHCKSAGKYWRFVEDVVLGEQWRPLPECDGYGFTRIPYAVSDQGRVRNMKDDRLLHPTRTCGHHVVNLTVDGQKTRRLFAVRRMVATAFADRPDGWTKEWKVVSLDGDSFNDAADNLLWNECTRLQPAIMTDDDTLVALDTLVDEASSEGPTTEDQSIAENDAASTESADAYLDSLFASMAIADGCALECSESETPGRGSDSSAARRLDPAAGDAAEALEKNGDSGPSELPILEDWELDALLGE